MYVFLYFWLHWVFMTALGLSLKMAPHSSTLAWKIPWTEEPGRLQSMGSQRVGHDWAASLSLHFGLSLLAVCWLLNVVASLVAMPMSRVRRGSGCGPQAQLIQGMWILPSPWVKPVSPALAGRFLTTGPTGKSIYNLFSHHITRWSR